MLRISKGVLAAWDLLHLLNDDYQKTRVLAWRLENEYNTVVEVSYLEKVVERLARANIIETKKGTGVRRSMKSSIALKEVIVALNTISTRHSFKSPSGKLIEKFNKVIDDSLFDNRKLLHKLKDF